MRSLSYIWRMALRRKTACLLVLVSTLVATVFMLFYPSLIRNTQLQLEETTAAITVSGSIVSAQPVLEPPISGALWKEMEQSGLYSPLYGNSSFRISTFPKEVLAEKAGRAASEPQELLAFQSLLSRANEEDSDVIGGTMVAYNTFQAADELLRIQKDISWLEGYDESCLAGSEHLCIVPESWGYSFGDTIPLLARVPVGNSEIEGIFRMKVVATYPGKITALSAAMPLRTFEELTLAANEAQRQLGNHWEWTFKLDEVYFTVRDNRQLEQIKSWMVERGLRDSDKLRLRIDDRLLKETTDPIRSNLAQLEGSYLFFFVMIAAIGFFISFLLARGRKAEYAVMRLLGESRVQITLKALLEQFVLCLAGVILGAATVGILERNSFDPVICAVILLCYSLGAAAAMSLTVRVNVMDLLRDKE